MKRSVSIPGMVVFLIGLLVPASAPAEQFTVFGAPLNLFAYVSQTAQFSLKGDHYDTEEGLQQALFTLLAEADYSPTPSLIWYVSGILTMDLVYAIKHDDRSWNDKLFDDSKDELFIDDNHWQVLKEAHVTWTPGDFLFRIGKQIVSWGEMDFFRIVDQINPSDDRRGFSDVEFETTIIPIWLIRAEWWPRLGIPWLQDTGIQFVFNPNAEFIPNQSYTTGNAVAGIWAPAYVLDNPLYPLLGTPKIYIGPLVSHLEEPEQFSAEGFEYGVRLSVRFWDSLLTLNGFYGIENSGVSLAQGFVEHPISEWTKPLLGEAVPALGTASDGTSIVYPIYRGMYPRQKFVGATWSRDLQAIQASFLGGVSPLVRVEALYQFDKVFTDADETRYVKSDYLHTGLGVDWKIKIDALNERAYFSIMPQFLYSRVLDYPTRFKLSDPPEADSYIATLFVSTSYFNGRLVPEIAAAYDISNKGHLVIPAVTYAWSNEWTYSLEMAFLGGEKENQSLWLFRKKDYIAVKVKYKWG